MSGAANSFQRRGMARRLGTNVSFITGFIFLSVSLMLVVLSRTLLSGDPMAMVAAPLLAPGESWDTPLGTDMLGRDILVQIAHGARISLLIGVTATVLSLTLGLGIGVSAGYFGGWVDRIATRVTELFQTLPQLLLATVFVAVLPPSVWSVVLAVGMTGWTQIARVVRAEVLQIKQAEFVQAASIAGMGHARVIFHEILPNTLSTVIVMTSILIASAILTEAALSFLGLGDPNVVSWGAMIGIGRTVLRDAWYVSAFPGIATLVTVLGFTLIGNGLNDAMNRRNAT